MVLLGAATAWWQAGPKAALSAAIAQTASMYCEHVDPTSVETNLLDDTKIVLHDVVLKKQVLPLQLELDRTSSNTSPKAASMMVITGRVKQITFSWSWSFGASTATVAPRSHANTNNSNRSERNYNPQDAWVQDASLTIQGMDVCLQIEVWDHDGDAMKRFFHERQERINAAAPHNSNAQPSRPNTTTALGSLKEYLQQQIAMVVDSLNLNITEFTIRVTLPPATANQGQSGFVIVLGGAALQNISHGRKRKDVMPVAVASLMKGAWWQGTGSKASSHWPVSTIPLASGTFHGRSGVRLNQNENHPILVRREDTILEQVVVFDAFFIDLYQHHTSHNHNKDDDDNMEQSTKLCPILDTFSYTATLVRSSGERFRSSLTTGLKITGDPSAEFRLFAGNLPMEALDQLGKLVKERKKAATLGDSETDEKSKTSAIPSTLGANADRVSVFQIPFTSISIVRDDWVLFLPNVVIDYQADGSVADIQADGIYIIPNPEIPTAMAVSIDGFKASLKPYPKLELQLIQAIYIPGLLELVQPIETPTLAFLDNTLTVQFDSIHVQRLDPIPIIEASDTLVFVDNSTDSLRSNDVVEARNKPFSVPFPINFRLGELHVSFQNKEKSSISSLELDVAPGTKVAIVVQEVKTELWTLVNAALSAKIPPDVQHEIDDLKFAAEKIRVKAGYSIEDWIRRLRMDMLVVPVPTSPKKQQQRQQQKPRIPYRLPFVHVEELNVRVDIKGYLYSAKEVGFVIKSFTGNQQTTEKDLISYYIGCILSRSPGFVTNAEILGIDVWDSAATTYGFYVLATYIGPMGGLATIAGVDTLKGLINAGKRARKKTKDDDWQLGDVFRGIFQHAKESARKGAQMRSKDVYIGNVRVCKGKSGGAHADVFDWAIGATANFGKYAGRNKGRLAGAVTGGLTMISAALFFASPLIGMAAGVVVQASTEKVVDKVENVLRQKKEREEEWRKQKAERAGEETAEE